MRKHETCLVLGANGFIGSAVADILELKCYPVERRSLRTGPDLRILDAVRDSIASVLPDYIFNCAAHVGSMQYVKENPRTVFDENTLMARNIYKAIFDVCDKQVTVINPLSNCSYPGDVFEQRESDWLNGPPHESVYAYAQAKRFLHTLSVCYAPKIRTINMLVPNSFGPGDSTDPEHTHALSGMIVRMIQAKCLGTASMVIWGSGKPVREWGYIADIAELISRAPQLTLDTWPLNLAQGRGWSIARDADEIKSLLAYGGELVFDTTKPDGAPTKILDATRFREVFPFFQFTDHKVALRKTIEYYESVL